MKFRGMEMESYCHPEEGDSSVCDVQGCYAELGNPHAKFPRLEGWALCSAHMAQAQAFTGEQMPIDKPFAYHKPSTEGLTAINRLREKYSELQREIEQTCPPSRHKFVAITELETSAMWAIKAVVFNDPASETE